jgi:hypothetical protein
MEGVIATMQAVSFLDGVNIKVVAFFVIHLLLGWRLLHFGQLVGAHAIIVFNLREERGNVKICRVCYNFGLRLGYFSESALYMVSPNEFCLSTIIIEGAG